MINVASHPLMTQVVWVGFPKWTDVGQIGKPVVAITSCLALLGVGIRIEDDLILYHALFC